MDKTGETITTPTPAGTAPATAPDANSAPADAPSESDATSPESPASQPDTQPASPSRKPKRAKRTLLERVEIFVSKLSTRNNFWNRICSMIWLPYAAKSGITMKRVDDTTFRAVLPFRRFNRNWYNAMAGAALLGNSEIAGGSYVFRYVGGDYTVVCKHLEYTFKRPCFGPAEYRITPKEDIEALVAAGTEFNITLDMEIVQLVPSYSPKERQKQEAKPKTERSLKERFGGREKRVGRCTATFHVTPKQHQKSKGRM